MKRPINPRGSGTLHQAGESSCPGAQTAAEHPSAASNYDTERFSAETPADAGASRRNPRIGSEHAAGSMLSADPHEQADRSSCPGPTVEAGQPSADPLSTGETIRTQVTPDDVAAEGPITPTQEDGTPTERQLGQDVMTVNPSVDSMESRG